jgi:hypothetical protein
MDYITRVCDMLEKVYKVNPNKMYHNEIDCTRRILESSIGSEKNKLLTLKAQLEIHKNSTSHDLNWLSLLIAAFSFVTTASAVNPANVARIAIIEMAVLIVYFLCIWWSSKTNRNKWRQYIAIAIEEIEKEKFPN